MVMSTLCISVAEIFVMFILNFLPSFSTLTEAAVDGILLFIFTLPMLYVFLFRPLIAHLQKLNLSENALRRAHDELDTKVQEQTADLLKSNDTLRLEMRQREKADIARNKTESEFRSIFEMSHEGIIVSDHNGTIISVNPAGAALFGYQVTELIMKPVTDIMPERYRDDHVNGLTRVITTGVSTYLGRSFELYGLRKDGSEFPVEFNISKWSSGDDIYFSGVLRDITQRKKAEEERITLEAKATQTHKMEAIGTLAGGIAHDFNNILTAVIGYTELAMGDADNPKILRADLEEVIKGANRAKELVKQILTFSRKSDQQVQPLRVQLIVKEALKLLYSSIPTTIEIRQNIDPECQTVLADPTQIHQIIMNLCTNAYHAMREKGGVLGVFLQQIVLKSEDVVDKLHLKTGAHVKLAISDTGVGMTKDILKNIFEPYFTTKEKGEGTGLGLSVVHGIVTSLEGDITVNSEPGSGTTFAVYIPTVETVKETFTEELTLPLPTGHEHILFVDDDEAIIELNKRMLEKLGYKITALSNSLDTLKIFKKDPDSFDLVVTDMTMPKMTGAELAQKILVIRPQIPIILCSGFSELINEEKAKAIGISDYLIKPVNQYNFAMTIRKRFDAA
jgi:PAS domain S-box-containing protein